MDMRFESAWNRVAIAGREMGSGIHVAALRIADGVEDWLLARHVPEKNAGAIAVGVAVGLVMAGDEKALDTLTQINREWLANR